VVDQACDGDGGEGAVCCDHVAEGVGLAFVDEVGAVCGGGGYEGCDGGEGGPFFVCAVTG